MVMMSVAQKKSAAEYEKLVKRCEAFDAELMADLRNAGGKKYARIGALAYRQCFAASKFVADDNGPNDFVLQRKSQQRLHRHVGRVLSQYAAVPAVRPVRRQIVPRALHELRRERALEISVRAARPRHLPARQRPGLWRWRAHRRNQMPVAKKVAICSSS